MTFKRCYARIHVFKILHNKQWFSIYMRTSILHAYMNFNINHFLTFSFNVFEILNDGCFNPRNNLVRQMPNLCYSSDCNWIVFFSISYCSCCVHILNISMAEWPGRTTWSRDRDEFWLHCVWVFLGSKDFSIISLVPSAGLKENVWIVLFEIGCLNFLCNDLQWKEKQFR